MTKEAVGVRGAEILLWTLTRAAKTRRALSLIGRGERDSLLCPRNNGRGDISARRRGIRNRGKFCPSVGRAAVPALSPPEGEAKMKNRDSSLRSRMTRGQKRGRNLESRAQGAL